MSRKGSLALFGALLLLGVILAVSRGNQASAAAVSALWLAALAGGAVELSGTERCRRIWQSTGKLRTTAFEGLALLLIFAAATWMYWPAPLGDRPLAGDHNLHFYHFWYLLSEVLPNGSFYGWSNKWFAGEPIGYLYPFFGLFWPAAVYFGSFGWLNMDQSYAAAVWLAYALEGAAVYYTGRYIFNRAAGLAGALLYLTDIGAYLNMGGWYMTVRTGVWLNTFSLAFSLAALVAFFRLLEERCWRGAGWLGLFTGVSILIHPLQIMNIPVMFGTASLAFIICRGPRQFFGTSLHLAVAAAAAVLISAFWLLPFISAAGFTYSYGMKWFDLRSLGASIYLSSLYPGMWDTAAVLGFIGLFLTLASAKPAQFAVGVLSFCYLFLGSIECSRFFARLVSEDYASKIEYVRVAVLLRPFVFMACGWMAAAIAEFAAGLIRMNYGPQQHAAGLRPPWRAFIHVLAAGVPALPLLVPYAGEFVAQRNSQHFEFSSGKSREQIPELVAWLNGAFESGKEFFRVAHFDRPHMHWFFDLGTQLKAPVYNIGWSPATGYRYQLGMAFSRELLSALSVRYLVVADRQMVAAVKADPEFGSHFKLKGQFGRLYLQEFTGWSPQRFRIISGVGDVETVSFEEERVVLRALPGSNGVLRLAVSYFDRWHAARDGIPIPISTTELGEKGQSAFMTVELKEGLYEFTFIRQWPERIAPLLGACGLLLVLGLIFHGLPSKLRARSSGSARR